MQLQEGEIFKNKPTESDKKQNFKREKFSKIKPTELTKKHKFTREKF